MTLALTAAEIAELARRDGQTDSPRSRAVAVAANPAPRRHIQRMWPNFEITGLTLRSVVATKCRAAQRTFDATGEGIVWAVLDSGIDAGHRHFAAHANLDLPDGLEPRSFVPEVTDPLVDLNGHGTHVAGIIAGGLAEGDAGHGRRLVPRRPGRGAAPGAGGPGDQRDGPGDQAAVVHGAAPRPHR